MLYHLYYRQYDIIAMTLFSNFNNMVFVNICVLKCLLLIKMSTTQYVHVKVRGQFYRVGLSFQLYTGSWD